MKSPKVSKSKIEQVIDLGEVLEGVRFRAAPDLKLAIGQAIADHIVSRTERGEGVSFGDSGKAQGVRLKSPYSDSYSKSLDFKAAGKSKSKVDMSLTGDMLASIQVENRPGNKIAIKIEGEEQVLKAFNHITGDTVPKRPFFGVGKGEVKEILADFKSEIKDLPKRATDDRAETRRRLSDVLAELEGDLDE